MPYPTPVRARRGRPRKNPTIYRRRKALLRQVYPRRPIASRTHIIKRLGIPMELKNNNAVGAGSLQLIQNGGGSFLMGTPAGDTISNTWQVGLSAFSKLNSVSDYTDITSLFDRYKIVGVKYKVMFQCNTSSVSSQGVLPVLYSSFDGDDADVPATSQEVAVKGYVKSHVLNANKIFTLYMKPRIDKQLYQTPFSTGYSSEKACWIDCTSSDVPHYGMKFWLNNWLSDGANEMLLRIQPTYYLALKDTQ